MSIGKLHGEACSCCKYATQKHYSAFASHQTVMNKTMDSNNYNIITPIESLFEWKFIVFLTFMTVLIKRFTELIIMSEERTTVKSTEGL